MIALALLLAAAPPAQTAADAERAFAAMAQRDGQWTAFRAYAADDAIMFTPEQVNAQAFLKDRKDPPASVAWQPRLVISSCDGRLAVSTGPWRGGAKTGTFTTIWHRRDAGEGDGWRWLLDHGRDTPAAVSPDPVETPDSCTGLAMDPATVAARGTPPAMAAAPGETDLAHWIAEQGGAGLVIQRDDQMPTADPAGLPVVRLGAVLAGGRSADATLAWQSRALADAAPGAHDLAVWQWRKGRWALVLYDLVGVAAQ